ncbi:MAG: protein-disulfide reductase DsbD domain-containing protein, partial [Lysobacter sp.]
MIDQAHRGRRLRAGLAALAFATLASLLSAPALAVNEEDLLPVDEAFAVSADADAPDRIAISWKVAKGYYLYRHRISVKADAGFAAQPLQLPKGKPHKDQFFGDVETYHSDVRGTLTGKAQAASTQLTIKYQGCAEAGVCYPPQTRTLTVALAGGGANAAVGVDPVPGAASPLANFGNRGGTSNPLLGGASPLSAPSSASASAGATDALPLPPEQAFGFEAIAQDGNSLLLRFTPARGYYLYRDKTSLKTDRADIAAGAPRWPQGTAHRDEHFGNVTVFFNQIDVPLPLIRKTADAGKVVLIAGFQGCQTNGICYPPMTRKISVDLPRGSVAAAVPAVPAATADVGAATAPAAAAVAAPPVANAVNTAGSAQSTDAAQAAATAASDATATSAPANTSADAATAATSSADAAISAAPAAQSEDARLASELAGKGSLRWLALLGFYTAGIVSAFTACVLPMIPILSGLIAGASSRRGGISVARAVSLTLVYVLGNAVVFAIAGVVAG